MDLIISAHDLWKTYRLPNGSINALSGAELCVPRGSFTAIIGRSGSGKSTLLHILGCLDRPSRGVYYLNGTCTESCSPSALAQLRRKHIGFVFQGFHLIPRLSAEENVALPLLYRGHGSEHTRTLARDMLDRVGLSHRCLHRPCELSGGQQQRVAIARAMITRPDVLLADEPTGNLDEQSAVQIMELLRSFHREGMTVVLITHDMRIAASAEHLLRIKAGRIHPM